MEKESLDLQDLVGLHMLSGVDMSNEDMPRYWGGTEQCSAINFVLDGKTYTALEDPNDGYRSMMADLFVSDRVVTNTFEPVQVLASYKGGSYDTLVLMDTKNGKPVLEVGTSNTDDYYPSFVSDWMPENLSLNAPTNTNSQNLDISLEINSFDELKGYTLSKVENLGDEIVFTLVDGQKYKLYHSQDCCESVTIEDVVGELDDLIGEPLLMAEEATSGENPEGITKEYQDSFTWTFYRLATIKGYVTIRWYGESNGYYSESVDFAKIV